MVEIDEFTDEVREMTWAWMLEYNEERDDDGLGGMTPAEALENVEVLTKERSTSLEGEAYGTA